MIGAAEKTRRQRTIWDFWQLIDLQLTFCLFIFSSSFICTIVFSFLFVDAQCNQGYQVTLTFLFCGALDKASMEKRTRHLNEMSGSSSNPPSPPPDSLTQLSTSPPTLETSRLITRCVHCIWFCENAKVVPAVFHNRQINKLLFFCVLQYTHNSSRA